MKAETVVYAVASTCPTWSAGSKLSSGLLSSRMVGVAVHHLPYAQGNMFTYLIGPVVRIGCTVDGAAGGTYSDLRTKSSDLFRNVPWRGNADRQKMTPLAV
jgi:hypothetical protein